VGSASARGANVSRQQGSRVARVATNVEGPRRWRGGGVAGGEAPRARQRRGRPLLPAAPGASGSFEVSPRAGRWPPPSSALRPTEAAGDVVYTRRGHARQYMFHRRRRPAARRSGSRPCSRGGGAGAARRRRPRASDWGVALSARGRGARAHNSGGLGQREGGAGPQWAFRAAGAGAAAGGPEGRAARRGAGRGARQARRGYTGRAHCQEAGGAGKARQGKAGLCRLVRASRPAAGAQRGAPRWPRPRQGRRGRGAQWAGCSRSGRAAVFGEVEWGR
jgi:hypothetical protein